MLIPSHQVNREVGIIPPWGTPYSVFGMAPEYPSQSSHRPVSQSTPECLEQSLKIINNARRTEYSGRSRRLWYLWGHENMLKAKALKGKKILLEFPNPLVLGSPAHFLHHGYGMGSGIIVVS